MRKCDLFPFFVAALGYLMTGWGAWRCPRSIHPANGEGAGHAPLRLVPGPARFSNPDQKGRWTGFDVDFCRAVAAAVLGDGAKVRFFAAPQSQRAKMFLSRVLHH